MNFLENLSPAWQALIASLFTCLMTTTGAFIIFFSDKPKKWFSVIAESSAAGIMLAASFFSLLNPAFEYPAKLPAYVTVTLGFCIGGAFIVLTDRLLSRSERSEAKGNRKSRLLYAAVTLHNVPEGMAVGVAFAGGAFLPAVMLAFGIGIQNIPEGLWAVRGLPFARGRYEQEKELFLILPLGRRGDSRGSARSNCRHVYRQFDALGAELRRWGDGGGDGGGTYTRQFFGK